MVSNTLLNKTRKVFEAYFPKMNFKGKISIIDWIPDETFRV